MARDTNFYYSFLVLPRDKRRAILAVWDFCRAVDDAVDEAPAAAGGQDPAATQAALARALDVWRKELAACFGEGRPSTAQGRSLEPWIRRFNLPRQPFEDLIEGVASDAGAPRFADFEALREYCYRVASTIGLICVEIFGYEDPRAREYAVSLGLALQLTNILRDIRVDLAKDRLYVPLDEMAQFGCSENDLRAGRLTPQVVGLLRYQAERARSFYREAAVARPRRDARRLVAAEIMGAIYRSILDRIERRGYDVFSEVVRVPRPERALIAARVWARTMVGIG